MKTILGIMIFMIGVNNIEAQTLKLHRQNGKVVQIYEVGDDIEFRIKYRESFPIPEDVDFEPIEVKISGYVKQIKDSIIHLRDEFIVSFHGPESQAGFYVPTGSEKGTMKVHISEITSIKPNTDGELVAGGLLVLGALGIIASPLISINLSESKFNTSRFVSVLIAGSATFVTGIIVGALSSKSPIELSEIEGHRLYNKYRPGYLSIEY